MSPPGNQAFLERLQQSGALEEPILAGLGALDFKKADGLLEHLIRESLLPKERACELWGDMLGVACVNPLEVAIGCAPDQVFPESIARKAQAICLYEIDGVFTMAMAHPEDERLIASLGKILNAPVNPVFAHPGDIEAAICLFYKTRGSFNASLESAMRQTLSLDPDKNDELERYSREESVVALFDSILLYAMRERASDIHLESGESGCWIRFRVDGRMRKVHALTRRLHRALTTRLKVLCHLDVAETRLPQDGRFGFKVGDHGQDFRVSMLPGLHGEKAVLRLLGSASAHKVLKLDELVMARSTATTLRRIISAPNGIFIVTGPTGSGKTTTLYSALDYINAPEVNIVTIEDPVEYQLPGVNHVQVNRDIDLTFPRIMRSILRQDPDVILVGEIRDVETAKIAVEAALTGHFVFTTLHTNNAIQAVMRLVEIGVDPYLVAPTTMGVMAQRLLARVCPQCQESYQPTRSLLERYFEVEETALPVSFKRGRGCSACGDSGYRGRVGAYELIEISEEMRGLIAANAPLARLTQSARAQGFRSMRYDALCKVLLGLTTIEEMERHTIADYIIDATA